MSAEGLYIGFVVRVVIEVEHGSLGCPSPVWVLGLCCQKIFEI